jgi:hypothetical protein
VVAVEEGEETGTKCCLKGADQHDGQAERERRKVRTLRKKAFTRSRTGIHTIGG